MQGTRDQFFARAAFAQQQHRPAVMFQFVNDSQEALSFRRVTDQAERGSRALEERWLLFQSVLLYPIAGQKIIYMHDEPPMPLFF